MSASDRNVKLSRDAQRGSCVWPQDIYKFVTHEKGILGSQDEYNRRHRKLCQPPFRSPQLLQEFASVVVHRYTHFCLISAFPRGIPHVQCLSGLANCLSQVACEAA